MRPTGKPRPQRLALTDMARLAAAGLHTRPLRVILSALGIAIGIAAMVAVVGISASSQAQLEKKMSRLGTDLLVVSPNDNLLDQETVTELPKLPKEAVGMVSRIDSVYTAGAIGIVEATAHRSANPQATDTMEEEVEPTFVFAADVELARTVHAKTLSGNWFNQATANYPTVVLGYTAAHTLGIAHTGADVLVPVNNQMHSVIGILDKVELAPELDEMVLVGWSSAQKNLKFDGHPTAIYERSASNRVKQIRKLLPSTVNPMMPEVVTVSRPSDGLAAKSETKTAFRGLLLGLGAVALLVGGIGVANTMVISVLERRSEIGLRRALGATRRQIWLQFLMESLLLSFLGGIVGAILGVVATAVYSGAVRDWPVVVPPWVAVGAAGATLIIGAIAGLYPAIRAARLNPTQALSGT